MVHTIDNRNVSLRGRCPSPLWLETFTKGRIRNGASRISRVRYEKSAARLCLAYPLREGHRALPRLGRISMAGPYGPPASDGVHKYLNNQSLVSNQGLDSADPDSYHCCCFHSLGAVEEEVVREPRRPGSGPAMRSRSPEDEGAGPGALPVARRGQRGRSATRNKGEPAYPT